MLHQLEKALSEDYWRERGEEDLDRWKNGGNLSYIGYEFS